MSFRARELEGDPALPRRRLLRPLYRHALRRQQASSQPWATLLARCRWRPEITCAAVDAVTRVLPPTGPGYKRSARKRRTRANGSEDAAARPAPGNPLRQNSPSASPPDRPGGRLRVPRHGRLGTETSRRFRASGARLATSRAARGPGRLAGRPVLSLGPLPALPRDLRVPSAARVTVGAGWHPPSSPRGRRNPARPVSRAQGRMRTGLMPITRYPSPPACSWQAMAAGAGCRRLVEYIPDAGVNATSWRRPCGASCGV
jgi:hypothetical protein